MRMREEILAYLSENEFTINPNLIGFIKREFPKVTQKQAMDTLSEMIIEKIIGGVTVNEIMAFFPRTGKYLMMDEFSEGSLPIKILQPGIKEYKDHLFQELAKKTNQSFIDTNKVVDETNKSVKKMNEEVLPKNFKIQRNMTIASILVAGAAVILNLASIIISTKGITYEQLQETNKQLQLQTKSLDSMRIFQRGIDSSLRIKAISAAGKKKP